MFREVTGLSALALAICIAVLAVRSQKTLDQEIVRLEGPAARMLAQDRLIGGRIDLASLVPQSALRAEVDASPTVVWLLDMERCPDCFDSLGPWSRLETLEDHRFLLVYTGTPSKTAKARLRSLTTTEVIQTKPELVAQAVGWVPPNTKLLVDGSGIVLLADSRNMATDCGWSFEAQVGALKGLNTSLAIRGIPTSTHGDTP